MIRRELPLTTDASPAEPVANVRRGFSFVLAPAAADSVHHPTDEDLSVGTLVELDSAVHRLVYLCFFLIWKVFAFVLSVRHAAICCLQAAASALIPIAQMKPNSSRATAVMVFL
jgi:hypothetical protein